MNVFYIPNVGYVFNEKIWIRFEKLVEDVYNKDDDKPFLFVTVCDENNDMDAFCKESWITCLNFAGVKYQDA